MEAKQASLASRVRLNNGVEIPWLGLGVYRAAPGRATRFAVSTSLQAGYRHVDTARIYGNEADVGAAIKESGIPRQELFVTTKLWNSDQGYRPALRACRESLKRLGLEYVDLYLIHWPVAGLRGESWRALVQLVEEGRARAIGVSNYMRAHLEELLRDSPIVPAVNQIEQSPFLYQPELLAFCKASGVQVEAYSPLTKGQRLDDPVLAEVARRYRRSPAQILIRWALEHELVVLPKAIVAEHIQENARVFDFSLTRDDLARLDGLDEGLHTGWDPTDAV